MNTFAVTAELAAQVWTPLYTIPASAKTASANINLCNLSAVDKVTVKVAIGPGGGDPANAKIIEPGKVVEPNGVFIRTGEPMAANEIAYVWASAATVAARHSGFVK